MHADIRGIVKQSKRLANGTVRIYAYVGRGGPLLCQADGRTTEHAAQALRQVLGREETLAKWLALQANPTQANDKEQCISGLIAKYLASASYQQLAASTKSDYLRYLARFEEEFGDWRIRYFERHDTGRDIAEWRNDYAHSRRTADYMVASVSRLFSWARSEYLTSANPTADLERLYRSNRSDVVWTDEELERVVAAAATDELRWAIKLAALTGLRQGDLLKLPWSAIQGNALVRKTSKKGKTVILPVAPLTELLASIPRRSPVILTSSLKRPWAPDGDGLRSSFYTARKLSGVMEKDWHDLRGTAATRLAKAGLTDEQIGLWMGWEPSRVRTMLNIYVSQESVADEMLARLNGERQIQTADKPQS